MSTPMSSSVSDFEDQFSSPNISSSWLTTSEASERIRVGKEPRLYQVDLSLPPEQRYIHICRDHKEEMAELAEIYDSILACTTPFPRFFKFLGKRLLRKVHSKEETRELKGISQAACIPLHLVVAYNTFLDLLSGCMSGGARTGEKIVHFRNLDWEMDTLRDMIIRVEYVLGGRIIARTVTYAGYIGVLTGVREGLSISMNYRSSMQSKSSTFKTQLHYLNVILGRQPSISSQLRFILLSPGQPPTLDELAATFKNNKGSPSYLTFCTPTSVLTVEKHLYSALTRKSDKFLAVTNHDESLAMKKKSLKIRTWKRRPLQAHEVMEIMKDSMARKECIENLWRDNGGEKASIEDLKTWLRTSPIRNGDTHFACIMDPSMQGGGVVWLETYLD